MVIIILLSLVTLDYVVMNFHYFLIHRACATYSDTTQALFLGGREGVKNMDRGRERKRT